MEKSPQSAAFGAWPRGAVIYQIYPRSFQDSNDDGVGDLNGITKRLDYVASLGVDGIWLSPFFTSPMRDFGYDVSDYCDVDSTFGSLADFDSLIAKAHALGLKVIIDQVYSHSSDQHPWFQASRKDRRNEKANWYVWADPMPDGTPPNNWMSVFGGVAWEWDARRGQYFLHNFLASQPDLNLHNPEVQNAMLNVARFWLDRGVDGFRLDAINFAMHDPQLRDNPPVEGRGRTPTRPFDFQEHRYNQSHADIPKFLERIRAVTDEYPHIFTVAEVVGAQPLREMKAFTSDDRHLSSAYNFDFLYADKLTPSRIRRSLEAWPGETGEAFPSWAFSNHDAPRCISRWADAVGETHAAKLYLLLLMSLRGNIFLYQGEELGLPQADVAFEELQDPEAIANWPETLGRDGARTPMPWESAAPNAGFSKAKPWLPVDSRHYARAVDVQDRDPTSVLNFTRRLLRLRHQSTPLREGAIRFLDAPDDIVAFLRGARNDEMLCVFNLGRAHLVWRIDTQPDWKTLITTSIDADGAVPPEKLAPLTGYIATRG